MLKHDDSNKSDTPGDSGQQVEVTPAKYLRAVKANLRNGKQEEAYKLLQQASVHYPGDPFILSYYGCFQAVMGKKFRSGVENCRKAIALLKKRETFGEELIYPAFYLNLGRAYAAAGKKKDALDAFEKGLQYDNSNNDLLGEMKALGMRKRPVVPFLDRSNPINKYIGMIVKNEKKG